MKQPRLRSFVMRCTWTGCCMLAGALPLCGPALAQTATPRMQPSITALLNSGYTIAAASSDGVSQFVYLQGANAQGHKQAYACQLQFGPSGGFRGCLVLP